MSTFLFIFFKSPQRRSTIILTETASVRYNSKQNHCWWIKGVFMPRVCSITGKKGLSGNRVSHANNKTRRRFNSNLQEISLMSETLGHSVRLRMTARGIRTVEAHGGLDAFLLQARATELQPVVARIKRAIKKRTVAKEATTR